MDTCEKVYTMCRKHPEALQLRCLTIIKDLEYSDRIREVTAITYHQTGKTCVLPPSVFTIRNPG